MPAATPPKETLYFSGVVLPPSPEEHDSLQHACEEFSATEAEKLCGTLEGLPLCLEHGDGESYGCDRLPADPVAQGRMDALFSQWER